MFFLSKFVFFLLFFLTSLLLSAQDSIIPKENISEKTNLKFQDYFFKALTEKAIFNYKTAIENLEECNTLIPNNKAVLFELSKNYLLLNKLNEAIEYGNQALVLDPSNVWLLEHLVKIYKRNYNFEKAITLQKKIAKKHPKKKIELVFLHLQNKDKTSAKRVLNELTIAKLLNTRLRKIKESLNKKVIVKANKKTKVTDKISLKEKFKSNKDFSSLQELLDDLDIKNDPDLLTYSEQGLALFPAQPIVYLMNGKAYNKHKKHKKAINSLHNGIDFVIDNPKMKADFYTQLIEAYKALGDTKNVRKYRKKLKL